MPLQNVPSLEYFSVRVLVLNPKNKPSDQNRIVESDYPAEAGTVHILTNIWNYLRSIVLDAHRTFMKLVNVYLHSNNVSEQLKRSITI